ncbi:hypothetical protein HUU42_01175 [bacterium]|nr:hypothetical protein [bacterium]
MKTFLENLAMQRGHFVLESGMHTDLWITMDALFIDPRSLDPHITALSELLKPYGITAVCGPMLGGAFLAQALAMKLNVRFYFCQPLPVQPEKGLFTARYKLPAVMRERAAKEKFAVADEIISAGSSARVVVDELTECGASVAAIGTLLLLGNKAVEYFQPRGLPIVSLGQQNFNLWPPPDCPLCKQNVPLENKVSSSA